MCGFITLARYQMNTEYVFGCVYKKRTRNFTTKRKESEYICGNFWTKAIVLVVMAAISTTTVSAAVAISAVPFEAEKKRGETIEFFHWWSGWKLCWCSVDNTKKNSCIKNNIIFILLANNATQKYHYSINRIALA